MKVAVAIKQILVKTNADSAVTHASSIIIML